MLNGVAQYCSLSLLSVRAARGNRGSFSKKHLTFARKDTPIGRCLGLRYFLLSATGDLQEAIMIVLDREALSLRPQGDPDRSASLDQLATVLTIRHTQLRATADLDEAILLRREVLDLRPPGHPDRSITK